MSDSTIQFGPFELPSADRSGHFAFVGTTGSGKTVTMRLALQSLLPDIGRGLGHRGIIFDPKGDQLSLLSAYCDRKCIKSFNPWNDQGVAWDLARDINEPRVALELTFNLMPKADESQPYFTNACRSIMYKVICSFMLSKLNWTLLDLLRALENPKTCRRILLRHPQTASTVKRYFARKDRLDDVFSTMDSKVHLLYEPVAACWQVAKERIAIRDWINNEWILILTSSAIAGEATNNLNRSVFKRSTDVTLNLPDRNNKLTIYAIDEVSEVGKLPSLPSLLKLGRSKNAVVLIAFQTIGGLRDPNLYGQHATDEIMGEIGNRFFGRIEDPETAEYASRVIGDSEVIQESSSRTSSFQHSSTTTNRTPVIRRAVLASEFMSMPPCDDQHGLSAWYTLRSAAPCFDTLDPESLFGEMLIPPADDVEDFVMRDPMHQYFVPWTKDEEAYFAPKVTNPLSRRRRRLPIQQSKTQQLASTQDLDDLDI